MPHNVTAPAITINAPDINRPVQKPQSGAPQPQAEVDSCYLCDEQNPGDFAPTTKFLDGCLLCNRSFCPIHKGQWDHVCNINHSTYYHEHPNLPDVYPSLGEREKALFTSPITLDDGESYNVSPILEPESRQPCWLRRHIAFRDDISQSR